MSTADWVKLYRDSQFTPFPTMPGTKEPPHASDLGTVSRTARWMESSNVALFAGSENGFVAMDADTQRAQDYITGKLQETGYYDWTIIVRTPKRQGLHFWMRCLDVPAWAQSYYKFPEKVGGGELRLKHPAYVLVPPSKLVFGEYKFVQGDPGLFIEQPVIDWATLANTFMPGRNLEKEATAAPHVSVQTGPLLPNMQRRERPVVLLVLSELAHAEKGDSIKKVDFRTGQYMLDTYPSRSEAEASVVYQLVRCGWSYDEILDVFEKYQPTHYTEAKDRFRYLENTHVIAIRMMLNNRLASSTALG